MPTVVRATRESEQDLTPVNDSTKIQEIKGDMNREKREPGKRKESRIMLVCTATTVRSLSSLRVGGRHE